MNDCDLISRSAAISDLQDIDPSRIWDIYDIEEWFVERPSVTPDPSQVARDIATIIENEMDMRVIRGQNWIPCSETVDIPDYEVLACDKYGEYIIGLLEYADDQWLCESEEIMMYEPIAWMPLPEPYQKEGMK